VRIAAAQIDVQLADVDANGTRILEWIDRAVTAAVDLVVFPECALSGYCFESRREAETAAIGIDDPLWKEVAERCRSAGNLHAVIGFLQSDASRIHNASALVGPAGIVASYRKVHLPHLGVDRFVDRGTEPYRVHATSSGARVGLAICYDSSFPEPMRVLGLAGADVIALPTNWPVAARRTADIVPPARSMENHLYFVAANRIGRERDFEFCGLSSICGPDGVELARAGEGVECLIHCDADLAVARNKQIERTKGTHVIDRFADRRPEFYSPISEPIRHHSVAVAPDN
jgi:predicted amidohydrolase